MNYENANIVFISLKERNESARMDDLENSSPDVGSQAPLCCMRKLLTYLVYSNTHSVQFMACLQHQVQQYKWKVIMNMKM